VQQFYGLKKASVVMLFKVFPSEGASAPGRSQSQVFVTIPLPVYSRVKDWLTHGAHVSLRGHMAAEQKEGGAVYDYTHLVADDLEPFAPGTLGAPAAGSHATAMEPASMADLRHTLQCLQRVVEAFAGPADSTTRLDVVEAVASVCVIAKGHRFLEEQRQVYGEILTLMRHNGKEDGNPRRMDAAEMTKCGEHWVALLVRAAERVGLEAQVQPR